MYTGLSTKEANKRLKNYGGNTLTEPVRPGFFKRFFEQMKDFMIITLLFAAGISFVLSFWGADGDFIDSIIILAIVILNALLGVFQEAKAEHSLSALKKLSTPLIEVLRDGKRQPLPSKNLVPGDVFFLTTGNYIPADSKVLSHTHLQIEESALTGESIEIDKEVGDFVFSGTVVVGGQGICEVVSTGMNTEIGKIANMISYQEPPKTPLQKKLARTGRLLGLMAFVICIGIFILGILNRQPLFPMFLTAVSLAVAAIPEGLPAIVTIMLSLGVERMARRHAVIRHLPAVETLGCATVICSDKTGTLTQNEMTVTDSFSADSESTLARYGLLCNHNMGGIEKALSRYAKTFHLQAERELSIAPIIDEIPFDSTRKCMTTLHRYQGGFLSITKGAPELIIKNSTYYLNNQKVVSMTTQFRKQCNEANLHFAKQALRVIAIAYSTYSVHPVCQSTSLERGLTMVGLVACMDPPRKEVVHAITQCQNAHIRPVMITGDHPATAQAIGHLLHFPDCHVMTGEQLAKLTDEMLFRKIYDYNIYARVLPADKVRLVQAFQRHGEIVAMTGDGVNDAPALKAADIGCAMGLSGTDVAKNAADMVLTDDNFATILAAVEEGRGIFDNIKKSICFLLSCNIGEIMTIFVAILMGQESPLLPVQLLFINLVTDSFPAICLGLEPPEADIMRRPSKGHHQNLFSSSDIFRIITEGFFIGSLALVAHMVGGTTMCFAVLALSQIVHSFNMRSTHSLFHIGFCSNSKLLLSGIVCVAMQISVIAITPLQNIFHTQPLSPLKWVIVAILSLLPIPLMECQKKIH